MTQFAKVLDTFPVDVLPEEITDSDLKMRGRVVTVHADGPLLGGQVVAETHDPNTGEPVIAVFDERELEYL